MKRMLKKGWLVVALLAASMGVFAEDIDLFVGVEPEASTDYPNVIIFLDNTSNWSNQSQAWPGGITQGQAELRSIKTVINSLAPAGETAKINIGLMMIDREGGGYVRSAMRLMDAAGRDDLVEKLDEIDEKITEPLYKVPQSASYGYALFEVFKYFGGYTSPAKAYSDTPGGVFSRSGFGPLRYAGQDIFKKSEVNLRDKSAFYCVDPKIPTDLDDWDDPVKCPQLDYIPAASSDVTCKARNYLILVGNTWPVKSDEDAAGLLKGVGGDASQVYVETSAKTRYADEMARFLYQTDVSAASGKQGVITYTIDVYNAKQDFDHTRLLRSMAHVGGGKYFSATSEGEIKSALNNIFSEIQSVNSVFASVSLPVSVNTQGTYLNQVYVGMFRPDQSALPRWAGNLKQYKMGLSANKVLRLEDAGGTAAINSSTGFITECARSFWGPSSLSLAPYWGGVDGAVGGGCLSVSNSAFDDYPDGNVVEKGAQSYKLRTLSGISARNVKTCSTSACTGLADFTSSTVTSITADEVNWARGADNATKSEFSTDPRPATTTIRPSVHGDIVHSRPVAINFGDDTNKEVVVFYGGNDGLLRAVNGNRDNSVGSTNNISGVVPGGELWSFMPPEFYTQIKRLRDNSVKINFKDRTVLTGETVAPKPYGIDGAITAYQGASATWLYATMRRGGRALYAFDVTTPQDPSLKWRVGCNSDGSSCTSGFDQLGQTWSSAKPFKAAGYGSGASPLVIMGGGYDTCEDYDGGTANHNCGSTPKGNQIYILDADTGQKIQVGADDEFVTERSVIGDVTIVPDNTGKAKYAYAADTGGNVYRITFGTAAPADWTMTRIASLGCGSEGNSTCDINRKFMFAPDVVEYGGAYYVLLGSGDREKPLASYIAAAKVSNYFFMIKDKPADSTWLTSESTNCGGESLICMSSLQGITGTDTPSDADLATKKGWYLAFSDNEQVVTSAITVYGVVTFSTHIPAVYTAGQCSSLGTARVYNIDYANAESANGTGLRYEQIAGGGLPPSPVAGMVTLDDGTTVPFVIGSDPDSPLEGGSPSGGASTVQPKAKVYWNIEQ